MHNFFNLLNLHRFFENFNLPSPILFKLVKHSPSFFLLCPLYSFANTQPPLSFFVETLQIVERQTKFSDKACERDFSRLQHQLHSPPFQPSHKKEECMRFAQKNVSPSRPTHKLSHRHTHSHKLTHTHSHKQPKSGLAKCACVAEKRGKLKWKREGNNYIRHFTT